jgi:hypothetical protein
MKQPWVAWWPNSRWQAASGPGTGPQNLLLAQKPTAKIVQLPLWPEAAPGAPNPLLRSALFPVPGQNRLGDDGWPIGACVALTKTPVRHLHSRSLTRTRQISRRDDEPDCDTIRHLRRGVTIRTQEAVGIARIGEETGLTRRSTGSRRPGRLGATLNKRLAVTSGLPPPEQ